MAPLSLIFELDWFVSEPVPQASFENQACDFHKEYTCLKYTECYDEKAQHLAQKRHDCKHGGGGGGGGGVSSPNPKRTSREKSKPLITITKIYVK